MEHPCDNLRDKSDWDLGGIFLRLEVALLNSQFAGAMQSNYASQYSSVRRAKERCRLQIKNARGRSIRNVTELFFHPVDSHLSSGLISYLIVFPRCPCDCWMQTDRPRFLFEIRAWAAITQSKTAGSKQVQSSNRTARKESSPVPSRGAVLI